MAARVAAEGEAAPGARAARLAPGHARQPGALRDGVARRTAGDRRRSTFQPTRRSTSPRSSTSAATGWRCWKTTAWRPPRCVFRSGWVSSRQSGRARPGGRVGRQEGLCPRRHRAHPHRPAVRRRGHAAGADRPRALVRNLSVPAGGTDVDVPVSADWGPGAYVTVHVFRTAADAKSRPGRAIGLAWVGIDPGVRKLAVAFDVAGQIPAAGARRDQGARGARRLGQPCRGGRGHPAADQLRLARSVRPLPRPPQARARHPRRLGPADRPARRRGHRAATGRRRRQLRAAGHPAEDGDPVRPTGAGRRRRRGGSSRSTCPTSTARCG